MVGNHAYGRSKLYAMIHNLQREFTQPSSSRNPYPNYTSLCKSHIMRYNLYFSWATWRILVPKMSNCTPHEIYKLYRMACNPLVILNRQHTTDCLNGDKITCISPALHHNIIQHSASTLLECRVLQVIFVYTLLPANNEWHSWFGQHPWIDGRNAALCGVC